MIDQEKKYDVVIFDRATRKIVSIPGLNLPAHREPEGTPCASDTYTTHQAKIDSKNYDIDIVEAGTFKKGDQYK